MTDTLPMRRRSDHLDIHTALRLLCGCTAALVVLDGALTYLWLHTGIAIEGNPVLAALVDVLGNGWAMTVRTVLALTLIGLGLVVAPRQGRALRWLTFGMAGLCAVYVAVLLIHLNGWASQQT